MTRLIFEDMEREHAALLEFTDQLAGSLREGGLPEEKDAEGFGRAVGLVLERRRELNEKLPETAEAASLSELRAIVERHTGLAKKQEIAERLGHVVSDDTVYNEAIVRAHAKINRLLEAMALTALEFDAAQRILDLMESDKAIAKDTAKQIAEAFEPMVALGFALSEYYLSEVEDEQNEAAANEAMESVSESNEVTEIEEIEELMKDAEESEEIQDEPDNPMFAEWVQENPGSVDVEISGKVPASVKKLKKELTERSGDEEKDCMKVAAQLLSRHILTAEDDAQSIRAKNLDFFFRRGYANKYTLNISGKYAEYSGRAVFSRSKAGDGLLRKLVRSADEKTVPFGDDVSVPRFLACLILEDFMELLFEITEPEERNIKLGRGRAKRHDGDYISTASGLDYAYININGAYAAAVPLMHLIKHGDEVRGLIGAEQNVSGGKPKERVLFLLGELDETKAQAAPLLADALPEGMKLIIADPASGHCEIDGETADIGEAIAKVFGLDSDGADDGQIEIEAAAEQLNDININEETIAGKKTAGFAAPCVFAPVESFTEDYIRTLPELLAESRFIHAYALTSGFAPVSRRSERMHTYLKYALDLRWDRLKYSTPELEFLDDGFDDGFRDEFRLKLPILLRAAFAPDMKHDYALPHTIRNFMNDLSDYDLPYETQLRTVFSFMLDTLSDTPNGFSAAARQILTGEDRRADRVRAVSQAASNLFPKPNVDTKMAGANALNERIFGYNRELYRCLTIVSEHNTEERAAVKEYCARFTTGDGADDKLVSDYMQNEWTEARSARNSLPLQFALESKIRTNLRRRLDVLFDWLILTNGDSVPGSDKLEFHGGRVKNALADLIEQIIDSEEVGETVLCRMAARLLSQLMGRPDNTELETRGLLLAPYIRLTDDYEPIFDWELSDIRGFEPWRLALDNAKYIKSYRETPENAILKIDDAAEKLWFSNYGQAKQIHRAFGLPNGVRYDESVPYAQKDLDTRADVINSDLGLKLMNGCISEQFNEDMAAFTTAVLDRARESSDFARANLALDSIESMISAEAENNMQAVRLRADDVLASALNTLSSADKAAAMISAAIGGGRLVTAEDYLNRLEIGDISFAEGGLSGEANTPTIERFLELYDGFLEACSKKPNASKPLSSWGYSEFKRSPEWISGKEWQAQHDRRAEDFVDSWPQYSSSLNGQPRDVERFLKLIAKNFGAVTLDRTANGFTVYKVQMTPSAPSEKGYAHPIAEYGTNLPSQLNVVLFAGNKKADQIYSTLLEHGLTEAAVVLVDGFFTLAERRVIAEKFRSTHSAALVIDRILCLYLAAQYDTERMKALLACSLPYAYSQPFTQDGNVVSDEMFVGRRTELNDIQSPNGTCIVYGGRQLGKTALLKRAKSLENKSANNHRAVFMSAFNLSGQDFTDRLSQELQDEGIISETGDMLSICREIKQKINRREIEYLLILVDEADMLLRSEQETGYRILNEIVNLREEKPANFKCVFAGLHNVMRSSKAIADNSPIPKLGRPLCIRPFSYADARRLVRYPMSYLGISIGDSQLMTILTESNNYPGNLHLICGELVKDISAKFTEKYRNTDPPFAVDDAVLGGVVRDSGIRARIREKLMLTLTMDSRYYKLACAIAFLGYDYDDSRQAFSAEEIGKIVSESDMQLDKAHMTALLEEMKEMGVLTESTKNAEQLYRFRKSSFRQIIGSQDDALAGLLGGE